MKIGLAQINMTVGDMPGNLRKMHESYHVLVRDGAELVVFPELVVCGYPPRDLLFKTRFVPEVERTLDDFAQSVDSTPAIVGTVVPNPKSTGRPFYNAVAWIEDGAVKSYGFKSLLPTYDVFDEDRYFEPSDSSTIVEWKGYRIGLTICEDIWNQPDIPTADRYHNDPIENLKDRGVDLVINCSASPWHVEKDRFRIDLVRDAAKRVKAPLVYCNAVGGNDELIFDGRSFAVNESGDILGKAEGFVEQDLIVDLASPPPPVSALEEAGSMDLLFEALTLGLRDYAQKCGFAKALIGLSGGIDSALTAAIAARALGKGNVIGVSLPSAISSQHSRDDARDLAQNLGIRYETVSIAGMVDAASSTLMPLFDGFSADVTEENVQARARGLLLMAMSNKFGALLLTTGNKSELAVGYCTLYGDMCGGLAVISDLPKTTVFELCRHINRDHEIIPWHTINKPPSAELRPDQKDEDSLPPYEILDAILHRYVEKGEGRQEIIDAGFDPIVVDDIVRKVDLNEYKRKQAAPGLKVTPLAFGVGRRIPIVQRYVAK
ncbi:MAG: NAD+ synthase [Verrucomicrobiota bacterium]